VTKRERIKLLLGVVIHGTEWSLLSHDEHEAIQPTFADGCLTAREAAIERLADLLSEPEGLK
jgi:hypothetical protein